MKILKILGIIVLILGIVVLAKDLIIKNIVIASVERITGAPVKIGGFSLSLMRQRVSIANFVLYNPPGFPKTVMVNIPEIIVQLDIAALKKGRLHIPVATFNLKEAILVIDKDGKRNVDALKFAKKEPGEKKDEAKKPAMPFQIDELTLSLGQVVMQDYSKGPDPKIDAKSLNIKNKKFKNITSPEQLAGLIVWETYGSQVLRSAAVYGIATVIGVGTLPVSVTGALIGNDSATAEFSRNVKEVSAAAGEVLRQSGKKIEQSNEGRSLTGSVDGSSVTIQIEDAANGKTKVIVSARKMILPQPETAAGIIYQLQEKLK